MPTPQKDSKGNIRTFGKCLDVIMESEISVKDDAKSFYFFYSFFQETVQKIQ